MSEIKCLGVGKFKNEKPYVVVEVDGEIQRIKSTELKPDKLIFLMSFDKWRERFPALSGTGISWTQAKSWLIEQCKVLGTYHREREIQHQNIWKSDVGEYIIYRNDVDYESYSRNIPVSVGRGFHRDYEPEFKFEWADGIGKCTRIK